MQLRDHPLMIYHGIRNWPPAWTWRSGQDNAKPRGEIGILRDLFLSDIEPRTHLYVRGWRVLPADLPVAQGRLRPADPRFGVIGCEPPLVKEQRTPRQQTSCLVVQGDSRSASKLITGCYAAAKRFRHHRYRRFSGRTERCQAIARRFAWGLPRSDRCRPASRSPPP